MSTLKNIAAAVASIVIFTNITNAQVIKAGYSVKAEEPMAVKYVGTDGNYLTFQVSVEPTVSANALFEIADKNEGELYTSTLAPNAKTKTIKIEKREGQVLDFKLVVGKNTYTKSFSVNTNRVETTTVEESTVTIL
jgi:hypothetical protein